jgi:hypothetical protein
MNQINQHRRASGFRSTSGSHYSKAIGPSNPHPLSLMLQVDALPSLKQNQIFLSMSGTHPATGASRRGTGRKATAQSSLENIFSRRAQTYADECQRASSSHGNLRVDRRRCAHLGTGYRIVCQRCTVANCLIHYCQCLIHGVASSDG